MTAATLDVNNPDTAKAIGTDLMTAAQALVNRQSIFIEVTDVGSLERAVADRQRIGEAVKGVQAFFKPLKQMADQLHKALCARENEITGPLLRLDRTKSELITAYKVEQDRLRREQEREQAERDRIDAQTRAAAEAAALESAGEHAMAAAVVEEAITAAPPLVILPDVTKQVAGLKFRRAFRWRYVNDNKDRAMALIPRQFLMVDEAKLGSFARSMKGSAVVPGVEFYHVDEPVR